MDDLWHSQCCWRCPGIASTSRMCRGYWRLLIRTWLISRMAQPGEFGASGLDALKIRLANLFERFTAELAVIVIEIRLQANCCLRLRCKA